MSHRGASESPWQEVRRGKQKDRPSSRTASENRGLQNPQPQSRLAPSGRSFSRAQSVLQATPNGRVIPPKIQTHSQSVPKTKENIPYEIKNRREWDPERRHEDESESSEDDDYYDSDIGEHPQTFGDVSGTMIDDGSQKVFSQHFQFNEHPHSQPPSQSISHPHDKLAHPRRRRLRVNFNYKRDNLARAAFRKRLQPTGKFMLPKDCPDLEPDQKKMYDTFDEIGVRLGSFIRPPQHVKDREIFLWGNARQIQNTKDELGRWLEKRLQKDVPRKPMGKDKFAREMSSIGDQYHRLMKKMQKEARLLEFQQAPAEGRIFPYTGAFIWPVDEVRPEDILGPSLEAFDPIRFQCHCHIIFDDKLSSFRIFSDKEDAIRKTMDRLVGTMREYVAKNVRPDKIILIEPPTSSTVRKDVRVLPASLNDPKATGSMIPVLTGNTLRPEARMEWLDKSNELTTKNNRHMELSLRKCIANLPYYRGLVQKRVHFGTFALKEFRWRKGANSTPFEEFTNDVSMPGTKGIMIRDLQIKKDATTIITKVQNATDLFVPMHSSIASLEEVVPSFSALFEFENPDSPPMNFVLELSSSPAAPTIYEKVLELWKRTDRRYNAVPLEVFTARLESGVSWRLQVSNENNIDSSRINPKMTEFAESVKFSKIPRTRTELTGQKVFTWKKDFPGIMQPSAFQQKTALRYRLAQQPEWEFEIARYDIYGNPKSENVPVETNWGATLFNTNWDSVLTANSTLAIGEAAEWSPRLETFFPSRAGADADDMDGVEGIDAGVIGFLKVVEAIAKLIDSIKKELPHPRG